MKHLNNSEKTFASTTFYFMEGSKANKQTHIHYKPPTKHSDLKLLSRVILKAPVSGPANISSYNLTQNSMVLQWSSIPEEDTRGFLLGYTIHYTEDHLRGTESENSKTLPLIHKLLHFVEHNNSTGITSTGCSTAHAISSVNFLFVSCFVYSSQFVEVNECCNHTAVFSFGFNDLIHYLM